MPNDRYSGVYGRVLIVLALGFLAGLVIPVSCRGQSLPPDTIRSVTSVKPDGTTVIPDTVPVLSDSAKAANLARIDSLFAQIDSLLKRTQPVVISAVLTEPRVEMDWRTASYATAILAGLAANTALRIDRDPCANGQRVCFHTAYHDSFLTRDKWDHFSASYFLTSGAQSFGVPKWAAFGLTCGLAGPGFELTQGAVSWKDITADCAGSATALGLQSILRKMHAEGWLR